MAHASTSFGGLGGLEHRGLGGLEHRGLGGLEHRGLGGLEHRGLGGFERRGLVGLLLVSAALAGCRGNTSDEAPVHLQQNMDFQERGDPQERSDFFKDGRVMRAPVEGTVAFGLLKEDDHMWRGRLPNGQLADALPAGVELTPALLDRGKQRYDIYCQPCHGELGYGDGPVTRRGGGFAVRPANLHQQKFLPAPLGYFYDVATNGKGSMMGYKAQIPVEDRWAIATWVRTLQVAGQALPADVPEQVANQRPRRIK